MPPAASLDQTVTAILGPTNTGKTHRAVERMLAHGSGIIGLPLRLLAREVYDRVSARVGEAAVALVTGEEKRVPTRPRYWVCTVEAMPVIQPGTLGGSPAPDYLVATDAIGMGLNMDIDCVAFADVQKFDGRRLRALENAELAQIAGRAGRHRRDGRFATLAPLPPLPASAVRAIEQHRFPPEERLYWRAHDLDFASLAALGASLRRPPPASWLAAPHTAEDQQALDKLARRDEVAAHADRPARVALLRQICHVPDYRQL